MYENIVFDELCEKFRSMKTKTTKIIMDILINFHFTGYVKSKAYKKLKIYKTTV